MDHATLLRRFAEERCSAILRIDDFALARDAMEAAVRGGFKIIEFTLTIPGALSLVREFSARDDLLVGAGTVLEPEQARAAVKAGARFLVSPVTDPEMIRLARELGALAIPGTSTPTEMWHAVRAGAPVVKLFPAAEKGPSFVRACLGPMPDLRIFPTSGVTEENAAEYLGAGAFGVGFVASLFDAAEVRGRAFDRIEARARRMTEVVRRCR
jgi:Entner-Doudoroff aldolase